MITKGRDPLVPCPRCAEMHRPDEPTCPNCGYPMPESRPGAAADKPAATAPSATPSASSAQPFNVPPRPATPPTRLAVPAPVVNAPLANDRPTSSFGTLPLIIAGLILSGLVIWAITQWK